MLDDDNLFDSDCDPETDRIIAAEADLDLTTHEEEPEEIEDVQKVLTEKNSNVQPAQKTIIIPSKVQEFVINLGPLKERIHFDKNKQSKKRYQNMGSNDKILESILCKIGNDVVDSAFEGRKCLKMFGSGCSSNPNECPFNGGGKGDDLVSIKRKISYVLTKIHFKCCNHERGCKAKLLYKEVKDHEAECNFRVSAGNHGQEAVLSSNYVSHVNDCKKLNAKIEGQYCDLPVSYKEIDAHIQECNMKPLNCINFPKCVYTGKKENIEIHNKICEARSRKGEFGYQHDPSYEQDEDASHDCLETLNDMIRSTVRHEDLCAERLERRQEERQVMKETIDELLGVLTLKQTEGGILSKEAKYYKDEVFKIKKRMKKEALKNNDGTLQDEEEDFRICTGKRPYICFAKNAEIDPALAKDEKCKGVDSKRSMKLKAKNKKWMEGKCVSCSHALCKICSYICSSCQALSCPDCKDQCPKGFNFCCEKCECPCGYLKVKILRSA